MFGAHNVVNGRYYSEYIHPPKGNEELKRVMLVYDRMGLSGAMGSVDCVHCR
jgi:hypothetical protein